MSENSTVGAALEYVRYGLSPIPIPHGEKAPRLREWQKLQVKSEAEVRAHFSDGDNIGLLLGIQPSFLVDVDLDSPEAVALAPSLLPHTDRIQGRPGKPNSHFFYRAESAISPQQFRDVDGTMLAELRSNGQQTIVAPSVHPSGEIIRWQREGAFTPASGAELAWRVAMVAAVALLARHWPGKGSRHDAALTFAGMLAGSGLGEQETLRLVSLVAQAAHDEEWRDREAAVYTTFQRQRTGREVTGGPTLSRIVSKEVVAKLREWLKLRSEMPLIFHRTDYGNAERLVVRHGEDIRWCPEADHWYVWNGKIWEPNDAAALRHAKETARSILREAESCENSDERAKLAQWAIQSENQRRIEMALESAKSEISMSIGIEQFDADPWLLNCLNGTLDLRSGKLREHRREDLCSKIIPVAYNPDARCEQWIMFLRRFFDDSAPLIAYMKRVIGYCLTGRTTERGFFVLYGTGDNGKSTFFNVIDRMLEGYAQKTDIEVFVASRHGDAFRPFLAQIKGARFVYASEIDRQQRLAESRLKDLTSGSEKVVARHLYCPPFSFYPQCKLFLATNYKPVIRGAEKGTWSRVRLIPFTVSIPKDQQDQNYADKLCEEHPGILAWGVRGCLDWQEHGLREPPEVVSATEEYRREMDTFGDFIDTRCVMNTRATTTTGAVYDAYLAWAESERERPSSKRALSDYLAARGFQKKHTKTGTMWFGIGLPV